MSKPEASDVMTDGVIAVESSETVTEAAQKMKKNNIRSLVVLEDEEAVGIIAGKDVLYGVVAEGRDPTETTVVSVMTKNLITASPHDGVSDIARAMINNDISRVPIMQGDRLVGIVTQTNIMEAWPGYVELLEEKAASGLGEI